MTVLINIEHFRQVSLQNPTFAKEIIERFLLQSQIYRAQLDAGIKQHDFRAIKTVMQQLKSQAMVFGAARLVQLIKRIEMANLDRYEQFQPVVNDAYELFNNLVEEVKKTKSVLGSETSNK